MITIENVTRVYSGKDGCMCGCRGKYYEKDNLKMIRKVAKLLNENGFVEDEFGEIAHKVIGGRQYVAYLAVRS